MASYPYSRSRTSKRYSFRVCDVRLSVEGPYHQQLEVQKSLGQLKDFTLTPSDLNKTSDTDSETEDTHKYNKYSDESTSEHSSPCPQTFSDDDNTPIVPAPFTPIQLQIKERPDDDTTPIVHAPFTPIRVQLIQRPTTHHTKQPKILFTANNNKY